MEEKELTAKSYVDKTMDRIKKDIKKFNIIFWIIYISFVLLYLFFMNIAFPKMIILKYLIFFALLVLFAYFRVVCKNIIIESAKKDIGQELAKLVSIETFLEELKAKNKDSYIRIQVGEGLVKYVQEKLLLQIAAMRKSVCLNLGYVIPLIRMADNSNLKSNECRIYIRGNLKNTLYLDTSSATLMEPLINETKRICISCIDEIIKNVKINQINLID